MKHHSERICIAGVILHIIFALLYFGMSMWNKSVATYAAGWLFAFGIIFWLLAYIDLRATRAAEEEEREEKEFERRRGAKETGKIFEEHGNTFDAFSARTRVKRLERWLFPGLVVIVGCSALFLSYMMLWRRIGDFDPGAMTKQLPSIAFLGGTAFFSFVFSRYVSGLSQEKQILGLRTCAGAMYSGTISVFLIAVAFVLSNFGYPAMERVMRYIISVLIGIVSIELLINFIMHFYRPRVLGRTTTPVYYSRTLSLIAVPQSIFRATAMTLDYQFGFKVSETWFYHFFERAAAPLILYLLISLYLFTSIIIVQSNEEVIVERFGRPLQPALGPGIHLKFPWPFDKSYRYSKLQVKELVIGIKEKEEAEGKHANILIWTQAHQEEEYPFIVAQKEYIQRTEIGDEKTVDPAVAVNFIALTARLQYRISNVFDFAYNKSNAEKALEDLAYRELVKYCATVDYNKFLGESRYKAEETARENIRRAIKSEKLGIELLSVNLLDVHPPVQTVPEFENVVGAEQEKAAKIWDAQGYASETLNKVAGISRDALINAVRKFDEAENARKQAEGSDDAEKIKALDEALINSGDAVTKFLLQAGGSVSEEIQKSDSERYRLNTMAKADSDSFHMSAEAFRVNPEIYKLRFRLQAMAESIINARKYIIPAGSNNSEVIILNLEDKAPSILDVPVKGKE
jgi:modulator of FtsH protease HflK